MVFFTCSQCGESMKKNQVEKHYQRQCRSCSMLSCVDCQKEFWGNEYESHTSCISEAEKYSGKNFQPKANANKGQVKQDKWIEQVQNAINKVQTNPKLRGVLERIKEYPNIPRKKAKFENFLKNSIRIWDSSLASQAWDAVSAEMEKEKSQNSENGQKPESKEEQKENAKEEDENQESEEIEKKQSKREKKEARKRKMNKEEKKDKRTNGVTSENDDKPTKTKKKKKQADEDEENMEEDTNRKKSKKKKKNKQADSTEDEETNQERHTGKKRKRKADDDGEPEAKHCRLNDTLEQTEDTNQGKFDWEATIISVLEGKSEKELPIKKLRKKVLAEFNNRGGDKKTSEEKLWAKFDKKIKKNPRLKVLKDKVKLVS